MRTIRQKVSATYLAILVLIGIFAPFLASERPIYAVVKGKAYYPLFQPTQRDSFYDPRMKKVRYVELQEVDWQKAESDYVLPTLAGYSPTSLSSHGNLVEPFQTNHLLGTDSYGRDIASWLIWGARRSLIIGILGMLWLMVLGLGLGGVVGYFGDRGIWLSRARYIGLILGLLMGYFYGFQALTIWNVPSNSNYASILSLLVAFFCLVFISWSSGILLYFPFFRKTYPFPLRSLVRFLTDIQQSIPAIIWLGLLILVIGKGDFALIFIIGVVSYIPLYRFTRNLFQQQKQMPFVEAAHSIGVSPFQIIIKYLIPNVLLPLIPQLVMGVAGILTLEASLSFLGIGVETTTPTWGGLLSQTRQNLSAWWLWLFPIICISSMLLSLYFVLPNRSKKQ